MPTSLRDIPGAGAGRRSRFRGRRRDPLPGYRPPILIDPGGGRSTPRFPRSLGRRRRPLAPRKGPDVFLLGVIALWVVLLGYLGMLAYGANRVELSIQGVADGALLTAEQAANLDVVLRADVEDHVLRQAELTLNGLPVDPAERLEGALRWMPESDWPLEDGEHVLRLVVPRALFGSAVAEVRFAVRNDPPDIRVPVLLDPVPIDAPVTIAGQVDPDVRVRVDNAPVEVDEEGRFELAYDRPPAGPVRIVAVDPAGNRATQDVFVPVEHPGGRGVHVSAAAWNHDGLRTAIFELIDAGRIDTVELSIKDESGELGHRTRVALANEIGATHNLFDLEDAVAELHARGVRVIGRVVAFRDPVLARAAWERGDHDWVIQDTDGQPLPVYGGFTNFAHPEVRRYNLAIALEAARAGVDEIMWDYIRRPEGALDRMVIPGLRTEPKRSIVQFLAEAYPLIRAEGVLHGAAVFGIAADRPDPVGQDIPQIARYTDVIAPMVYPSLWVRGEYGVADPPRMPYEMVKRSVADFQEKVEGTGTVITPWLQAFSLGHRYGAQEYQDQIRAVYDLGLDSWIFWSAYVRYEPTGFDVPPPRG